MPQRSPLKQAKENRLDRAQLQKEKQHHAETTIVHTVNMVANHIKIKPFKNQGPLGYYESIVITILSKSKSG